MSDRTPVYRIALVGLRRAGKTVYLAALDALRRAELDGSVISCFDAVPPFDPAADTAAQAQHKRELLERLRENAHGLGEGQVPAETDTADGIMTYRFRLTLQEDPVPGAARIIEIELVDYAGELLRAVTDEGELRRRLHGVVAETDGLLVLAETPPTGSASADLVPVQPLRDLVTALDKLHDDEPEVFSERAAALLVTKWDRLHVFDGNQAADERETDYLARLSHEEARHRALFDDWLAEQSDAAALRELARKLRGTFTDADFTAWPCSAFGEARHISHRADDGHDAEVSATSPLASLNLVSPLRFLVDRARYHHRTALEALTADAPPPLAELPDAADIRAEHGDDEDLLAHLEGLRTAAAAQEAEERRNHLRRKASQVALAVALSGVVLAAGTFWYRSHTVEVLRQSIALALEQEELGTVIAAQDRLAQSQANAYWLAPGLPVDEASASAASLIDKECALWGLRATQGTIDIDLARARQQVLPQCDGLDQVLAMISTREWNEDVRSAMNDLQSLTDAALCGDPRLLLQDAHSALTEVEHLLGRAPAGVDRAEIDALRVQAQDMLDTCLTAAERAARQSAYDIIHRSLENQKWKEFLDAARDFLDEKPEDIERLELVRRDLGTMPAAIRKWAEGHDGPNDLVEELGTLTSTIDDLQGRYPDLLLEINEIRTTTAEEIRAGAYAAMCNHVDEVVAKYETMRTGPLQNRNPGAVAELRDRAQGLSGDPQTSRIAEEIMVAVDKAQGLTVNNIIVTGDFPGRTGHIVIADLIVDSARMNFTIPSHTKDENIHQEAEITFRWPEDDTVTIGIVLEQDNWGRNTFLSGQSTITREALFAGLNSEDMAPVEIAVAIRDNARSRTNMTPMPAVGTQSLMLNLHLSAPPLPALRESPCPSN